MNQVDSWQGATILADAEDDVIGKTLSGTYSVERVLGEGGMGRVYLARHTRIAQKQVAVKVLHPEYGRNPDMLARFQREAETAASISHPNVVAVYDVARTPHGRPYLVTEYLEGCDLSQYLKQRQRLTLPTTIHIARQLCEGLAAAHRCGVIHRDLKPHNVFLVGDFTNGVPEFPHIKILDFGLSKFMDVADGQPVTKTGVILGTPAFMSPEQASGQETDSRSDIYGVGALLYTCLTGRVPFDEATPQTTVLAVIAKDPPRPRELESSIPEFAELVIQRAMAKKPAERFQTMEALLEALTQLEEQDCVSRDAMPSRPWPRAPFETQAEKAKAARPELILFLNLALLLVLGSVALAVTGIEQIYRWSLSRLELGLVLTCSATIAVTPTVLVARRIHRHVWGNTSRVVGLLGGVRVAVITAVTTYGIAWFGFRVFDAVVLRLIGEPSRANLTWPGWDFLLPVLGVGAGIVALVRERASSDTRRGWRRTTSAVIAATATLALAALVIPLGLRWQTLQVEPIRPHLSTAAPSPPSTSAQSQRAISRQVPIATSVASETSNVTTAAPPTAQSAPDTSAALSPSASQLNNSPATSSAPAQSAPEEELNSAKAHGVEGWKSLAERYPSDPRALRGLVLEHASRAAELRDAMIVLRRLFAVAPEEARRADVQYLVQRAAETPGVTAEQAWKLLAEDMGPYGPDVLYTLTLTKPKLAERAEQLLGSPTVRQRFSPALAVAHELKQAPSCSARLPLLNRAIDVGDERAVAILGRYGTASARGCGKNKRKPCPAGCPEEAEQFRDAIAKISQRLKGNEQ
jgi:serine/threonine-protein kinase